MDGDGRSNRKTIPQQKFMIMLDCPLLDVVNHFLHNGGYCSSPILLADLGEIFGISIKTAVLKKKVTQSDLM